MFLVIFGFAVAEVMLGCYRFEVGFPYDVLLVGVRRGRFGDRHVSQRERRPVLIERFWRCA